ncbi:response regulator [Paenibacillus lignilyticus]|uniref:Response regulator n=1 Tax=Paenibacillus lignilyticus TaxID=1172615 RepID=A0ABS5CJL5_9BACL|nr:response regulator [Paenibacillus lignilyticus]MBP3966080.1 response regulator [Paenibacillus lignilyticus]
MLIVDDIPSQVDSIAATIPKSELGITRIHKAYSGEEALAIFREHPIQLVITDIRMPEMSGVELIQEIRRMNQKAKLIVLSGYADFEYAQSIVPYNTSGYLMKPVNPEQLRAMLEKLVDEIADELKVHTQQQRSVYAYRENLPSLRGELLGRLLSDGRISDVELQRKLSLLELPFSSQQDTGMFVVRLEGRMQDYRRMDRALIEYAVMNMAEEVFHDAFHLWFCLDQNEYLVCIASPIAGRDGVFSGMDRSALDCRAAKLKKKAESLLNNSLSIALAVNGAAFPDGLPKQYRMIVNGIRAIEEDRRQSVFLRVADQPEPFAIGNMTSLYKPPLLLHLLDTGNWAGADKKLSEIFNELRSVHYPPEYANEAYFTIAGAYQYMAHKKGKLLSELGSSSFGLMPAAPSLAQLERWAYVILRGIQELFRDQAEKQKISLIDKVHHYVEQNMNGCLSLQTVAAHIGLHPAYLSRAYRAETGINLSDYILKYRMELATYMLRSSDKKIYEIAQTLGYQAVPHFIKLFKAHSNMTPQEYRERAVLSSG